jgi:hypothetical protein
MYPHLSFSLWHHSDRPLASCFRKVFTWRRRIEVRSHCGDCVKSFHQEDCKYPFYQWKWTCVEHVVKTINRHAVNIATKKELISITRIWSLVNMSKYSAGSDMYFIWGMLDLFPQNLFSISLANALTIKRRVRRRIRETQRSHSCLYHS